MVTSFIPGNPVPAHTLNFCIHACLPTVVRLPQISESYLQPCSCHLLYDASKGLGLNMPKMTPQFSTPHA